MKDLMRDICIKIRSDYWIWSPCLIAVGFQWFYIFNFQYSMLPTFTWGVMFGGTLGIIILNVVILFCITQRKTRLVELQFVHLEEQWDWIQKHCWFYYRHSIYEVWIPRKSTRMAFKLRWT